MPISTSDNAISLDVKARMEAEERDRDIIDEATHAQSHPIDEVRWDITKRCNLRCRHCYVGPTLTAEGATEGLTTEKVVALLRKLAAEGIKRIQYLGGEPFARSDFREILEETAALGFLFTVNTNGTYIDCATASMVGCLPRWAVTFSLDGPTADTNDCIRGAGTYERCVAGIRTLVSAKRRSHPNQTIAINTVLSKSTISLIPAYFELAMRLGVDVLQFNSMDNQGNAARSFCDYGVTPAQLLSAAVEITRYSVSTRPRFEVRQVYLSNIATKYISQVLKIPFDVVYKGCKAGKRGVFIDSEGRLYTCSELTYGRYPHLADTYGAPVDARVPLGMLVETAPFVAMSDLRDSRIHRTKYRPCATCEFVEVCHPCPLPSLKDDGHVNLLLCEEAHRRLGNGSSEQIEFQELRRVEQSMSTNLSVNEGICK